MRKNTGASYHKNSGNNQNHKKDASHENGRAKKPFRKEGKPFAVREDDKKEKKFSDRRKKDGPDRKKPFEKAKQGEKRNSSREAKDQDRSRFVKKENFRKTEHTSSFKKELPEVERTKRSFPETEEKPITGDMPLNKYIAHSGECSRRDAAEMVKQGKVRVNGELILEPGYRVAPGDQVTLYGKKLTPQKNLVYILLNKPKGYITTTEDPEERKTVMDLVTNADVERLFPVGRLDRNTTGVLLLTNDGALAHKLSHPSYNMKKVYHVTLDKNLTRADYEKIAKGIMLEDGIAQVDEIAYLENRKEVGLEIHSGKNRIVRRIFESLGYAVEKLDRVMYAGLTKKNVERGKWRFLAEKEIIFLKHFKG